MSEQKRKFEAFTGVEVAVGSVALPLTLIEGSELFEKWTHYPAVNSGYPGPTPHDWHPSTLETGGIGIGAPLLATAALVAATSLVRRFIHNRRPQPPLTRAEAPVPAEA